jgi:cobalt-precorrin 5A hydrolase
MGGDEIMIAIGIGCRRGAAKEAIVEIVQQVLSRLDLKDQVVELFSIEDKHDEAGLVTAAAELCLPIEFLSRAVLRHVEDGIATRSPKAEAEFGLTSVSEAAALAGAGRNAELLVPRIANHGVTCAVGRGAGR